MTDAERLAKAMQGAAVGGVAWPEFAQRLIDSGVVTVNPPPDPAAQIGNAYMDIAEPGRPIERIRRLIDDGWIVPGPKCEQ